MKRPFGRPAIAAAAFALPAAVLAFLITWATVSPEDVGDSPTPHPIRTTVTTLDLRTATAPAGTSAECRALVSTLPVELSGQRGSPNQPAGVEWGDPPILFRCGITCPAGSRPPSSGQFAVVDDVLFYVEHDADSSTWFAVDRTVVAGVRIPDRYQGQETVFAIAEQIKALRRSTTGRC